MRATFEGRFFSILIRGSGYKVWVIQKIENKLISFNDLPQLSAELHSKTSKIVTTNGCFDLLHWGHIRYLAEARELGDTLVVGVNSDRSVRKLKGESRPIFPQEIRALQLAGLESIDYVCIFDEDTPEQFISLIRPHVHVKGGDYFKKELPERKLVESLGGKLICLPLVEGFSTTRITELCKKT